MSDGQALSGRLSPPVGRIEGRRMTCRLFETNEHFVLRKGRHSLWCCRATGRLTAALDAEDEEREEMAEVFLYEVQGILGKVRLLSDSDWRLLLIRRTTPIGNLPQGGLVHRVDEVTVLPLTTDSHLPEPTNQFSRRGRSKDVGEKLEKRLLDALMRMLNGSESFYFTFNGDLTNSTQRQIQKKVADIPLWQQADERFFWNRTMLADLLDENYKGDVSDPWILPVVQGYVEIQKCPIASISGHVPRVMAWGEAASVKGEDIGMFFQGGEQGRSAREQRGSSSDGEREGDENEAEINVLGEDGGNCGTDPSEAHEEDMLLMSGNESAKLREPLDLLDSSAELDLLTDQTLIGDATLPLEGEHTCAQTLQPLRLDTLTGDAAPLMETGPVASVLNEAIQQDDDVIPGESDRLAIPECSPLAVCENHFGLDGVNNERSGSIGALGSADVGDASPTGGNEVGEERKSVNEEEGEQAYPEVGFMIISRRSRHRAGTRYKRRGADISGAVANYVETEFITTVGSHSASLVMVRGSVPILWSQPGYKYKPPPVVDKDHRSSSEALTRHFAEQLSVFQKVCVVNTLNQTGQERKLSDAYEDHLLSFNSADMKYVVFDFHHICRGSQQIHNVQILLDKIRHIIKEYRFCWLDSSQENSVLCQQNGVFRVNCMDCLDRTNVVQSYMAREVLLSMLLKLGLVNPECSLDGEAAALYNEIWANNGDAISMQYAGTAAMKGDLTRHGERKLAGLMKDGYNSAHRYLLNIFRDTYRQIAIDLMLGGSPSEVLKEVLQDAGDGVGEDPFGAGLSLQREELVGQMVDVCRQQLYPYYDPYQVDGWALCEPAGMSFLPQSDFEENVVMLLYRERPELTVANYDITTSEITSFIRIPLEFVDKVEIGPLGNMLRNNRRPHLRLHYTYDRLRSSFFTFKTTTFVSMEEDSAILEDLAANLVRIGAHIDAVRTRIDRKRSPSHFGLVYLRLPKELLEELEISSSKSKVLHEKIPSTEHPSYRDVHSDDELLDCRESRAKSLTGTVEEEEEVDGNLLGGSVDETGRLPQFLLQLENSGKQTTDDGGGSSQRHGGLLNGRRSVPATDHQSQLQVSHSAPSSCTVSPKQSRRSSRRKQGHPPPSDPGTRSSSPSPERVSPQVRRRPLRGRAAAKEFFSDKGFSKLKQKVLSKIVNINLAMSDKEDEDLVEMKRHEMWKKSRTTSIFIM